MSGFNESEATARRIVDDAMYLTLATADETGRPWASPLWFACVAYREFLWVSDPDARHSRNVALRPEVAMVIFDSTVAIGGAEAVYFDAVAEQVGDAELERSLTAYSAKSTAVGARRWARADVSGAASLRLYRATASAQYVLAANDERIAVAAGDG